MKSSDSTAKEKETKYYFQDVLNPTRRGLWNGHQEARPDKNPFKGPFGPIFLHRKGWGIKITSENFFDIGF